MKLNNNIINSIIFLSSLFLVACGSGSGKGKDNSTQALTEADFNNQTFIVKGDEQVADSFTFFNGSKTGVEFIGRPFAKKGITWEIKNKKLDVTVDGGEDEYSFSLEKINNNVYQGRKNGSSSFLYKALPLKPSDLNGKIFEFDLTGLSDENNKRGCTVRTLKVVQNKAFLKEICTKDTPSKITVEENLILHPEFANTVKFSFLAPSKDSILLSLISGDFKTSAEVVLVYQGNFQAVQIEKMKVVKKEAF